MLRNTKDLHHDVIGATDGEIGHIGDFLFDDDAWAIRYIVVDTGSWLQSRQVLISPISLARPDWADGMLSVSITKEQVRHSPDIDTHKPVSRQHEIEYMGYFGYPCYWAGGGMWGGGVDPYAMAPGYAGDLASLEARDASNDRWSAVGRERHRHDDPHLRSCKAVVGYHLHATDGEIGHVSGYLIDDRTWAIRYVIVDTSNWWLGHQVLVTPAQITGVHWTDETVSVEVTRAAVRSAPPYDPDLTWDDERDLGLHRHYDLTEGLAGRPVLENEV